MPSTATILAASRLAGLRWATKTPEQRAAHSAMMHEKRWKNHKKKNKVKKCLRKDDGALEVVP